MRQGILGTEEQGKQGGKDQGFVKTLSFLEFV